MLSVAEVPLINFRFRGVICVILWQGREYRLATYLGAKAVRIQDGIIRVIQGDMEVEAHLLQANRQQGNKQALKAPSMGNMVRTIHENVVSHAYYRFRKGKKTIFAFHTDRASFEYEYPV